VLLEPVHHLLQSLQQLQEPLQTLLIPCDPHKI
jgi:hypothetical protein